LPKAADEYSGHLRVTSSGEILYHFPNGFINRYKGFGAVFKRTFEKIFGVSKKVFALLFKIWIMVMLIGYFIIFLALALASVIIQITARSNNKGGGGRISFGLFEILIRIWFYSEIIKPRGYGQSKHFPNKPSKDKQPLHKAIFSFIFGDGDPNKNWEEIKNKAVIEYLQANNGVISLIEYMAISGENNIEAEKNILSLCSKYEGSPEVSGEGTVYYKFEKILLGAELSNSRRFDPNKNNKITPPLKNIKIFSVNKKKQNGWFIAINAFNLLFGSYFLYNSITFGKLLDIAQYQAAPAIYSYTHYFLNMIMQEPHNLIKVALGVIPLVFSFFFWLIPLIRFAFLKKENKKIKLTNFKRFSFSKIWEMPCYIDEDSLKPSLAECAAEDKKSAFDSVIKDIGAVSSPEIEISDNGITFYSFKELEKEKKTLEKIKKNIDVSRLQLGQTVFDSADD